MSRINIEGQIDLHCHYGPDLIFDGEYGVTAVEAVTEARDSGRVAMVLKAHDFPTPAMAQSLNEAIGGIKVFGGITLDYQVGGLNPSAVEAALNLGAKIVWLPTVASHQDVLNGRAEFFGYPNPGLRVTDDNGELLPVVREIFDLVVEHDAILATGHVTADEHFAVVRAFGASKRILVTHAMEELAGPHLTRAQCVSLVELGATVEFTAVTCLPYKFSRGVSVGELARAITAVGPHNVVLGSDLGFSNKLPRPAPGYSDYLDNLSAEGISAHDLHQMASVNAARLLRIDV